MLFRSDYGAAEAYLTFEHDEFTMKPTLDENGLARLTEVGGNAGDLTLWQERYHLFQTAISAVRNSYMPNAERKKEYLAIYRDITEGNNTLIAYIVTVDSRERTKDPSKPRSSGRTATRRSPPRPVAGGRKRPTKPIPKPWQTSYQTSG